MAKKIIIENVELGNSGEVSKDKINNNFNKVNNILDIIDGETIKKADTTNVLGFSSIKVPTEIAVSNALKDYPKKSEVAIGTILKGDKANESEIKAISNPQRGDTYKAVDTGHYWTFDGLQWNDIGEILPSDVATQEDLLNKVDKNELPREYKSITLILQNGFYEWNTGNFSSANDWRCAELDLSIVGREIYITGLMNNSGTSLVVYMDSSGNYIGYEFRGDGTDIKYEKQLLSIPANAAKARITAYYGTNGSTSTSPVLGAYTLNVASNILTSDTAKEEFTTISDFQSVTDTSPVNFERVDLVKENGYISPSGGLSGADANYKRAKINITDENRNKLYFTGLQIIKGAVIAAYFDEFGVFISSEGETDGNYTFYSRRKLNVPDNAVTAWIGGRIETGGARAIKTADFYLELDKIDYSKLNDNTNTTVEQSTNNIYKIAELDNSYVFKQPYIKRWFSNWLKIQEDKTQINAVTVPIVRDYIGNKFFTGDIIVSVVTSTGFKHTEIIPFDKVKKYNELDRDNSYLSDFDYIVYLNNYVSLNSGDWIQITSYCANETDKLALAFRYKKDNEPESEFFSVLDNGFYQKDGDTTLTDQNKLDNDGIIEANSELLKFNQVQTNGAWCSYCSIGLMSIHTNTVELDLITPKRIYTVCNDKGTTGAEVRNNRHYSAILQLDHFLTGLKKEPKDLRFLNNGQDRLLFYSPIESLAYGDAPTYNNSQNVLKQNKNISIGGGIYKDKNFVVEHISIRNSITKTQKPRVLCIGDSITVGEGDPSNVYHLLTKELSVKDWIDNGKINGEFEMLFLGHNKSSKTFNYKGENYTINSFFEGITGTSSSDTTIFFDTNTGKYTLKNWLAKYRTMDNTGNRLSNTSPDKGTDVGNNMEVWDVCVPNNIVFALGANDPITFDWLGNTKKFIADIKAEYVAENWGVVNIAIVHPDSAGTYFPSLHPNLSQDMYYWNTDNEGRHSRFWKFANDWLNDNTYNEDTDKVFYVPFMFTSPCDVAKNRPVILPDGEPIHVPFGWGATTHVYEKAYRHWAYQLYSWIKYAMSLE